MGEKPKLRYSSLWAYLLQLLLDGLLALFTFMTTIAQLMGSGPGSWEVHWAILTIVAVVFIVVAYRLIRSAIALFSALLDQRWWVFLGELIRLGVLAFALYFCSLLFLILMGSGASVGEPVG